MTPSTRLHNAALVAAKAGRDFDADFYRSLSAQAIIWPELYTNFALQAEERNARLTAALNPNSTEGE